MAVDVQMSFEVVVCACVFIFWQCILHVELLSFFFFTALRCVRACFVRFCINLSEHISYAYECKNSSLTLNCFLSSLVRNINRDASIADRKPLFIWTCVFFVCTFKELNGGTKRETSLTEALSNVFTWKIQCAFQYWEEKNMFWVSPCPLELVKRPFLVINYALKQRDSLFFCSPHAWPALANALKKIFKIVHSTQTYWV